MGGSNPLEQLEGGVERDTTTRQNWRKYAIIAVVMAGALWSTTMRCVNYSLSKNDDTPFSAYSNGAKVANPIIFGNDHEATSNVFRPSLSWDTDPDPSRTPQCKRPHSPDLPLVQYALMIDAGSTGSRIHIYKFNNCGPSAEYEYEVFNMTKPGLSDYAGRPEDAAKSLDVLLNEALRVVPEQLRSCAPVAVKATAGLRLLPPSQRDNILQAVEDRLRYHYPFSLPTEDAVVIMEGRDESVYAWLTANYLLNTLRMESLVGTRSYAVLDLGGASTQIVFEPIPGRLEEGEHKYELLFAGRNYTLYQHSYLGYGLMQARKHVHQIVNFTSTLRESLSDREIRNNFTANPCLTRGTKKIVEVEFPENGEKRNVTMGGDEIGSFEACSEVVRLVLAKDAICELKPCSFDGVYQPHLLDAFPSGKVLLLSYFYDRISPLLSSSKSLQGVTAKDIARMADRVCRGQMNSEEEKLVEPEDRAEWCLDLTFMYELLSKGYEFDDRREMSVGARIEGTELGWCLGATFVMIDGKLTCKD